VQILCEPVAVRHKEYATDLTRSHSPGKNHWTKESEKAGLWECQAEISGQIQSSILKHKKSSEKTAGAGFKEEIKNKGVLNMGKKCSNSNHRNSRLLPSILCIVLTVATALLTTGCNGKTDARPSSESEAGTGTETPADGAATVLGEGNTVFSLTVADKEGNETPFEIHTDKKTVGEALLDLGLIAGEQGQYGLYVQTVNGVTADYDKDGVYWAFYINGEYAATGVDSTPIAEGDAYSLRIE